MTTPISYYVTEARVDQTSKITGLPEDLGYEILSYLPPSATSGHKSNPRLWQTRMISVPGTKSSSILQTHKKMVRETEDWLPLIQKELENHPNEKLTEALKHPLIDLRQSEIETFFKIISQIKDRTLVHFFTKWDRWAAKQVPTLENKAQLECVQKKVEELKGLTQEHKARRLREWLQEDTLPILQLETLPFDPDNLLIPNLLIPPEILHFKKLNDEKFLDLLSQSVRKGHPETVKAMLGSKKDSLKDLLFPTAFAVAWDRPKQARIILDLDKEHKIPKTGLESLTDVFSEACFRKDHALVRVIIDSDRWHDIPTGNLLNAFSTACSRGDHVLVRIIMDSDRWHDIPSTGPDSLSNAFSTACSRKDHALVRIIMDSDRWHDIPSTGPNSLSDVFESACFQEDDALVHIIMNSDRWHDIPSINLQRAYEVAPPQIQTLLRTSPRYLPAAASRPTLKGISAAGIICATGLLASMGYFRYFV